MPTGNVKTARSEQKLLRATGLRFEKDRIVVLLDDQREVSVPLAKYPSLQNASPAQRRAWEMIGDGVGFHWEGMDLDLSTLGLVNGYPEAIPSPLPFARAVLAARKLGVSLSVPPMAR